MLGISNHNWKRRLKEISENRDFRSEEEILLEGVKRGYSRDIVKSVVDHLMDYLPDVDGFSIAFEDNVLIDYKIDDEDLGYLYGDILDELNIEIPKRKDQDLFMKGKTEKDHIVAFMIEFIQWCKKEHIAKSKSKKKKSIFNFWKKKNR